MSQLEKVFRKDPVHSKTRARALDAMRRLDIKTTKQLEDFLAQRECDIDDLDKFRGVGKTTLAYIKQSLRQSGYIPESETEHQIREALEEQRVNEFYAELEAQKKEFRDRNKTGYTGGLADGLERYDDLLRKYGLRLAILG